MKEKKGWIAVVVVLSVGLLFLLWRWNVARGGYEDQIARLKDENLELREELEAIEDPGEDPDEDPGEDPDEEPDDEVERARLWSLEDLEYHPQVDHMKVRGEEAGYSPGSTLWTPAAVEIPTEMADSAGSTYEDPGSLLMDFAETLGFEHDLGRNVWQLTSRAFIDGDVAVGVIMLWGFKDDSVAGTDYRVHMERSEGRWFITDTEVRHHCWRGLSEDELMCL